MCETETKKSSKLNEQNRCLFMITDFWNIMYFCERWLIRWLKNDLVKRL